LRPFPLAQINQIAGGISGNGRGIGKDIHFLVKVIVQGQDHRETFSKKVEPFVGNIDREFKLEDKVAHG